MCVHIHAYQYALTTVARSSHKHDHPSQGALPKPSVPAAPSESSLQRDGSGSTWRSMGSYKFGFISRVSIIITQIRGLMTLLITTHEPPSKTRI